MDANIINWLRLYHAVPVGVKVCRLIACFGSASAIFAAPRNELLMSGCVDMKTADAILSADEKQARDTALICEKYGWSVVAPDNRAYPNALKHLNDFPVVLFCSGDTELLRRESKISVVGTRSPSDRGLMSAYLLGSCLSSLGVVTVSGGAVGIDSAAHEGALLGNGGTIAVLGCGLGSDYLPQNSFMRNRIEKTGLLVSEFPPFSEPSRYTFPKRNRIIAALSAATVVAESGIKGGSLITAEYAVKQKKKVFCFSPDIVSSPGCEELVKNGAGVFGTPGELLEACGTDIAPDQRDPVYFDYDLRNDGIQGIHIIKPSTMTADSFAAYNGITPELARKTLGSRLKQPPEQAPSSSAKKEETKKKARTKKAEPKKKEPKKTEAPPEKPVKKVTEEKKETPIPEYLSEEAKAVLKLLDAEPLYFDEIQYRTSLGIQTVMTAVTELELEGLAALHPGNRVSKI